LIGIKDSNIIGIYEYLSSIVDNDFLKPQRLEGETMNFIIIHRNWIELLNAYRFQVISSNKHKIL